MDDDSVLGNTLSQLGGIAKKTGQQIVRMPGEAVKEAEDQVTASGDESLKDNKSSNEDKPKASSQPEDKATREVVEGLYSKSNGDAKKDDSDKTQIKGQPEFEKMMVNKTLEERKKLLQLHLERHKLTYADQLLHRTSKKPGDRPAEKVEKEKKQEMQELQQKEAKKPPPLVQRARERVEKFPGASG